MRSLYRAARPRDQSLARVSQSRAARRAFTARALQPRETINDDDDDDDRNRTRCALRVTRSFSPVFLIIRPDPPARSEKLAH